MDPANVQGSACKIPSWGKPPAPLPRSPSCWRRQQEWWPPPAHPYGQGGGRVLFLCTQLLRRRYLSHAQAYYGGLLIIAIYKLMLWN